MEGKMKSYILIVSMVILCWAVALDSRVMADHVRPGQTHLQLATVPEFKPFVWQENGRAVGIDVDIVKEICRRMDMVCDISFHPWKRVLANIESGMLDGGFSGFRTKEREGFARFTNLPLHHSTYSLFVKKGDEFEFSRIKDLHGKTIGIRRGFKIDPAFDHAVAMGNINIQEVESIGQNVTKLLAGQRIDAIAVNFHEMQLILVKKGLKSQVTWLPVPITRPRPAYLMISKKWSTLHDREHLIQDMDHTLKSMYDDGFIDLINSRYLD